MFKKIFFLVLLTASAGFSQVYDDSNNRFLLAQSYMQQGNFEKARDIFAELYNINPANPQYFQSYNEALLRLKEYAAAINLVEQKISLTPNDITLYGMLGSAYYLQGNEQKAFEVWDKALLTAGNTSVNYRVIANYAIERRAFDKAIEIMKKGKAVTEDPTIFSYDLANLYALTMGYKNAALEYCELLNKKPDQVNGVEARLYSYTNKPDALAQTIEVFEECKTRGNDAFTYLLANLYTQQKSYDKAYGYYREMDKKQGNQGNAIFGFAQLVYNEGDYKTASSIFKDIIDQYPNSPFVSGAKLGYAKTLEAVVTAEEESKQPAWKPYYKKAASSSSSVENVMSAYSVIQEQYRGAEPANEALLRMGILKFKFQDKPDEAKEYFNKIITTTSLSSMVPEAYRNLAEIAITEGKLPEAEQYLKKVSGNGRIDPEVRNSALYRLANVYFYKGDFNAAKDVLAGILDNLKDNSANDALELSLLLNTTMNDSSNLAEFAQAEYLAEQQKFEQAEAGYSRIAQNPKAFMLGHLAKIRVAEMELALDKYETSVELLSKISTGEENNIYADKALYLLGEIYQFGLKDNSRAIQAYEGLLAKYPNSLYLDEAREAILNLRNKPS